MARSYKALRDALGLTTGARADISMYGTGAHVIPVSRTARLLLDEEVDSSPDSDTS